MAPKGVELVIEFPTCLVCFHLSYTVVPTVVRRSSALQHPYWINQPGTILDKDGKGIPIGPKPSQSHGNIDRILDVFIVLRTTHSDISNGVGCYLRVVFYSIRILVFYFGQNRCPPTSTRPLAIRASTPATPPGDGDRAEDVIVSGPSGVGKTVLSRHTLDRLDEEAPVASAHVRCLGSTAGAVLREAITTLPIETDIFPRT